MFIQCYDVFYERSQFLQFIHVYPNVMMLYFMKEVIFFYNLFMLLFGKIMHCKFLVFWLLFSFSFSFSRALVNFGSSKE